MADHLPLLLFPQARTIPPPIGKGFPMSKPHFPTHDRQVVRIGTQIAEVKETFERYKADVCGAVAGLEPETVLVIEIAGHVDDFKQAVEAAGLEWLGEWDIDDIEPTDDFFELNTKKERTNKKVNGRLFVSLVNEAGLHELLSLWNQWENKKKLPFKKGKWSDVFSQILKIRRWGIEETLGETGMLNLWEQLLDPLNPMQAIQFQIELFYRSTARRRQNEVVLERLLAEVGGRTISAFIDLPDIAFHAVKAEVPGVKIRQLLTQIATPNQDVDIRLFKYSSIMYFRPTGQSLVSTEDGPGEASEFPVGTPTIPPVVAILDGVPNLLHEALKDRLLFDDPDNLEALYQPGERRHGSSMASLVVHGELDANDGIPLTRQVYHRPILQPDQNTKNHDEHVPENIFLEDRVHTAVRRMFERIGDVTAQAPGVKIINFSIGDPSRPFIHTPSPLARLLDWLSWKYRVLFCVSAGNFSDDIELNITTANFDLLTSDAKAMHVLKCVEEQLSERRLLSPGEAMNALTIGALHTDSSGDFAAAGRVDLFANSPLFSPASRLGHGFRKSVKPEVMFPGGRQLYNMSPQSGSCSINQYKNKPGQKVAWDSDQQGELSRCLHTRGTSNATALSTRGGARIFDVLEALQADNGEQLKESLIAVLIKALLVHGARHDKDAKDLIVGALKTPANSRKVKEMVARYIGYGAVDIQRVLTCTEQRGTVLGCGEIKANDVHEYKFPIPPALASRKDWRRLIVTMAWFSPINSNHRNLREAKLELVPVKLWDKIPLNLTRQDADHNQVNRGTIQHEVLEGNSEIAAFQDGENIILHITCKADATNSLDEVIPYGLAVTLEVEEGIDIPVYQQLRALIRPQVAIAP